MWLMPLYGPDTSDYQTELPEADFNIIKATEGVTWKSKRFPGWRDELAQRGVPRFFYHFAHPARNDPREEANALYGYVGPLLPGEGLALDYENPSNDAERADFANLTNAQHEAWIIAWLDRVEELYPTLRGKVLFYSYMGMIGSVGTSKVHTRMPLWIAGYGTNNGQEQPQRVFGTTTLPTSVDRWSRYTIWQYTSEPIDWNRADVTLAELKALTHQLGEPALPPPPQEKPKVVAVPNQMALVAVHSRLVLDAQNASTENGTVIMQHYAHMQGNQRWILEPLENSEFRIRGAASGRVLDVVGDGRENGARVQLWHWHGGANQRWRLEWVEGKVRIVSVSADKVLDVDGAQITSGAVIQLWERNGGANQLWEGVWAESPEAAELVPAPAPPPPPEPSFGIAEALAQIAGWNFFGGVKGFQTTAGIAVDGKVGKQTLAAVVDLIERAGKLSSNFHLNEFRCSHCGRALADPNLVSVLQSIRNEIGPMGKFSSFRCPEHPIEAAKSTPGQHAYGRAWDPSPNFAVAIAERHGAVGIGYAAADRKRCTHLDTRAGQRVYFQDN